MIVRWWLDRDNDGDDTPAPPVRKRTRPASPTEESADRSREPDDSDAPTSPSRSE